MTGEGDLGASFHYLFLALMVAAMAMASLRNLRLLMLLAGAAALVHYALQDGLAGTTALAALLVAVTLGQIVLQSQRARRGLLGGEERRLIEEVLQVHEPATQRHLLDLLAWRDIPAGEVLAREGQQCPPLIYVASGSAAVLHGEHTVGSCEAGDFVGEMSVAAGDVASATVTASGAMRVAVIDRDALLLLAQGLPEVARAFDRAINRGLAAKLKRMNAARAAPGE